MLPYSPSYLAVPLYLTDFFAGGALPPHRSHTFMSSNQSVMHMLSGVPRWHVSCVLPECWVYDRGVRFLSNVNCLTVA